MYKCVGKSFLSRALITNIVIFDQLKGHSRGLIQVPESCVRGPLITQARNGHATE